MCGHQPQQQSEGELRLRISIKQQTGAQWVFQRSYHKEWIMQHMVEPLSTRIHVAQSKLQTTQLMCETERSEISLSDWLKLQSGCKLFWIIWRRWTWTHQLSTPTLPIEEEELIKGQQIWQMQGLIKACDNWEDGGHKIMNLLIKLQISCDLSKLAKHTVDVLNFTFLIQSKIGCSPFATLAIP